MAAYGCSKCNKRIPGSAYHCSTCHDSFSGLTAWDAHRVDGECIVQIAADPFTAEKKEFWLDGAGVYHLGRKLTEEEKVAIWG
jgi:hypothetical protein